VGLEGLDQALEGCGWRGWDGLGQGSLGKGIRAPLSACPWLVDFKRLLGLIPSPAAMVKMFAGHCLVRPSGGRPWPSPLEV